MGSEEGGDSADTVLGCINGTHPSRHLIMSAATAQWSCEICSVHFITPCKHGLTVDIKSKWWSKSALKRLVTNLFPVQHNGSGSPLSLTSAHPQQRLLIHKCRFCIFPTTQHSKQNIPYPPTYSYYNPITKLYH